MTGCTLFVGIGSPHGDDRAGWLVADALAEFNSSIPTARPMQFSVRKAATPADLLDWLDGVQRLIVCDAVRGAGPPGRLHRWQWPDLRLGRVHAAGSHDFGLAAGLDLASSLGRLPAEVVVWGLESGQGIGGCDLSRAVKLSLPELIQQCLVEISGVASISRVR
jgi:hydrogenase maturation protease